MKIGIIGFPCVGKKTLFKLLTGLDLSQTITDVKKPVNSIAEIKDLRFDTLVKMYSPKKQVRAKINVVLFHDLEKDSIAKGDIFKDIDDADALCNVVRTFVDESVYHIEGSLNAKRDIDFINSELILQDLLFIEKRLERIEQNIKKLNDKSVLREKEILLKLKTYLDKEQPLRLADITKDEKKTIASYPFFTLKEMLVVLNVSESDLKNTDLLTDLKNVYEKQKIEILQISAKVETEIFELESEKERDEFLNDLGITESALNLLTKAYLKSLGLISFFTVGEDEVRQWCIKAGSNAPETAGAIHSDLEKGFIRAEVIKYNDLIELGSEDNVKHHGKLYLKGKDYIVEDGDIINVRFNV